mgnify:CR=1 FL=1
MKKSMLLVGAFLTVAAMAQAKEVVPAPVVVEEAPVQIVEKEVIVYRDKEEGFRPNGYVDLQYRYYGDTEGNERTAPTTDAWNKNNNYSRIQLQGNINMTENQAFEYRVRNYNSLDEKHDEGDTKYANGTETRLRYFYNHGLVGDSKIDLTSRIEYKKTTDDTQYLEYQARFDFADYMFNNDVVKTDYFVLAPKYRYEWGSGNDSEYDNQIGVDLYSLYTLPWGFSTEFNLYTYQHFYGADRYFEGLDKKEDKNFTVDVEWYLYNTTNLYTNGNFSVDFGFEGGLESYGTYQQYGSSGTPVHNGKYANEYTGDKTTEPWGVGEDDVDYQLYALPYIQANYIVSDNMVVYAAAGAEYRNWTKTNGHSASDWRWQPTAWAGFKTTF